MNLTTILVLTCLIVVLKSENVREDEPCMEAIQNVVSVALATDDFIYEITIGAMVDQVNSACENIPDVFPPLVESRNNIQTEKVLKITVDGKNKISISFNGVPLRMKDYSENDDKDPDLPCVVAIFVVALYNDEWYVKKIPVSEAHAPKESVPSEHVEVISADESFGKHKDGGVLTPVDQDTISKVKMMNLVPIHVMPAQNNVNSKATAQGKAEQIAEKDNIIQLQRNRRYTAPSTKSLGSKNIDGKIKMMNGVPIRLRRSLPINSEINMENNNVNVQERKLQRKRRFLHSLFGKPVCNHDEESYCNLNCPSLTCANYKREMSNYIQCITSKYHQLLCLFGKWSKCECKLGLVRDLKNGGRCIPADYCWRKKPTPMPKPKPTKPATTPLSPTSTTMTTTTPLPSTSTPTTTTSSTPTTTTTKKKRGWVSKLV